MALDAAALKHFRTRVQIGAGQRNGGAQSYRK